MDSRMSLRQWEQALQEVMPRVIAIRRELHRHPELGGEEVETQKRLMAELRALGLEVTTFQDCHAVMATLDNGPGRCVAIRADMDALPVQEQVASDFASDVPGRMHACGHDAHMALALGSAGPAVLQVQRWLNVIASADQSADFVPETGQFDAVTEAALESYQLTAGLKTLGVVDADTWESLRLAAQELCRECQEG